MMTPDLRMFQPPILEYQFNSSASCRSIWYLHVGFFLCFFNQIVFMLHKYMLRFTLISREQKDLDILHLSYLIT
jgi:hypothetical protein